MEAHYATRHRRNQTAMLAIQSTHDWKRSQRFFWQFKHPHASFMPNMSLIYPRFIYSLPT